MFATAVPQRQAKVWRRSYNFAKLYVTQHTLVYNLITSKLRIRSTVTYSVEKPTICACVASVMCAFQTLPSYRSCRENRCRRILRSFTAARKPVRDRGKRGERERKLELELHRRLHTHTKHKSRYTQPIHTHIMANFDFSAYTDTV